MHAVQALGELTGGARLAAEAVGDAHQPERQVGLVQHLAGVVAAQGDLGRAYEAEVLFRERVDVALAVGRADGGVTNHRVQVGPVLGPGAVFHLVVILPILTAIAPARSVPRIDAEVLRRLQIRPPERDFLVEIDVPERQAGALGGNHVGNVRRDRHAVRHLAADGGEKTFLGGHGHRSLVLS